MAPILATNNLPHFTDHSVSHSDELCEIVDNLTTPIADTESKLTDTEAFVLYAACYLHDIGMQHQNADETAAIQSVLSESPYNGQRWHDLTVTTRRTLLRDNHHRVSHEMVRSSVNAAHPILGVQLVDSDHPGAIGCVCESHRVPPNTDRYEELLGPAPNLRMPLLAALLRLADILDESRRRAQLYLQRTRELDSISQMHWWRHYFVASITFKPSEQVIEVWFDFPVDRRTEYNKLVPELQLPYLRRELSYHRSTLSGANLHWSLEQQSTPPASTVAEAMPNEVHMSMLAELAKRRKREQQEELHATLRHLQEHRIVVQRSFEALRNEEPGLPPDDHLQRATELAHQLWEIGGRRDAWMMLRSEQAKVKGQASSAALVEAGNALCRMMLDDDAPEMAVGALQDLQMLVDKLDKNDQRRLEWLRLIADAFVAQCAYDQAVEIISELLHVLEDDAECALWKVRLAEIHMLQGELTTAESSISEEGNHSDP